MERFLNLSLKMIFAALMVVSVWGCTRGNSENTTIRLQLPAFTAEAGSTSAKVASQSGSVDSSGPQWNSGLNPATLSDIDCYAVFVGGPESKLRSNTCFRSDTNESKIVFGPYAGFFPAGSQIALEVPSGDQRSIHLVGLNSQNSACKNMVGAEPDFQNLSYPHIISEKTVNLPPGEVVVNMKASLDQNNFFDECNFIKSDGTGYLFGDGRDGSISVTSAVTLNFLSDTYSATGVSYTPASAAVPNTKVFSSASRITALDDATRKTLTIGSFTNDEFAVGDEVLWHVAAGGSPSAPDDDNTGACGGGLYRGIWGFANIVSVSNPTVTLDRPVGKPTIPLVNSGGNLAETIFSDSSNYPFCYVQLIRVPQFERITIDQSTSFTTGAFGDASTFMPGGVLAFRVKELVLNQNLTIDMAGKGFQGVAGSQGRGLSGLGQASDANSNENGGAGGFSGYGGGGGAHVGPGGDRDGATGTGGQALTYCEANTPCTIVNGHKIFFGGAGGGDNAVAGGSGGGAVFVHAERIVSTSGKKLFLYAGGTPAGGSGAGGGAGGSIHLTVAQMNAEVEAYAHGSSGIDKGGGGGGGAIEIPYCAAQSSASVSQINIAGGFAGGAGTAAAGGAGLSAIVDEPSLCQ